MVVHQSRAAYGGSPCHNLPNIFDSYSATVVAESGFVIHLVLWDTAGAEEYVRLRELTYPRTNVAVLCIDICHGSHSNAVVKGIVRARADEIRQHMPAVRIVVVGTKSDYRMVGVVVSFAHDLFTHCFFFYRAVARLPKCLPIINLLAEMI